MRVLYLSLVAVWLLAASVLTTPMPANRLPPPEPEFGAFGPPRGTEWHGTRIDVHFISGAFSPEQIRDIWGMYEIQKEKITAEADRRFPDPNDRQIRSRFIEERLDAIGGPKDQLYSKVKRLDQRMINTIRFDYQKAWATIDEETAKWKARREERAQASQEGKTTNVSDEPPGGAQTSKKASGPTDDGTKHVTTITEEGKRRGRPPKKTTDQGGTIAQDTTGGERKRRGRPPKLKGDSPNLLSIADGSVLGGAARNLQGMAINPSLGGARDWVTSAAKGFPGYLSSLRSIPPPAGFGRIPVMGAKAGFKPIVL